jgi:hypothetical protein
MLLGESRNTTVRELLDPVSGLPHPILNGDHEAWTAAITIEYVPLRAFFSGKCGTVVDKACPKVLKLFSLGVMLPGPLLTVLSMLPLALLEGPNEAMSNVGDGVKVVSNLDGGSGGAG